MNKIPNDGFPVATLPAEQAPDPDFEASVCLKGGEGKCGHLHQITTSFGAGNPAGTFEKGKEPRETSRKCLRDPLDLNGLVVFTCDSHTDPDFRENPPPFVLPENLPPLVAPPAVMPTVCNAPPATAPVVARPVVPTTAPVVVVVRPVVARPVVARPPVSRVLDLSKLPVVKMNKDKQ